MTKLIRAISIFTCGLITLVLLSVIIPQLNFAQIGKHDFLFFSIIIGLSLSLIITSFTVKGHLNLALFIVSYSLTLASTLSVTYYIILNSGVDYNIQPILITGFLVGLSNVACELYIRKKARLVAAGCMSGRQLNDYAKHPWIYIDAKNKKPIFILYFDIPELSRWALSKQTQEVKKVEDLIFENVVKKAGEHDGCIVRRSEDSGIIVFEIPKRLEAKSFKTTETYTAYHAMLCAVELKALVDGLRDILNSTQLKNLKGRAILIKDTGSVIKHIRNGRMELSLFSDGVARVADMLKQSNQEDVICDIQVYELCSDFFTGKKLSKETYQVHGLSAHSDMGL